MSTTVPVAEKKPQIRAANSAHSNEDTLIIPFVINHFELTSFPEEKIEKRLTKEKLQKLLSELDRQVEHRKEQSRKKWRFFVMLIMLIMMTTITFIVLILTYGGQQTTINSVEAGKTAVASVFVILILLGGIGWLYTGAKGASENSKLVLLLEDINKRRGIKKNNLFLKFGHQLKWIELHYDYRRYKRAEQKKQEEIESMISGNILKKHHHKKTRPNLPDSPIKRIEYGADDSPSPNKIDNFNDSAVMNLVPPMNNSSFMSNKLQEQTDLDDSSINNSTDNAKNFAPFSVNPQVSALKKNI